MANLDKLIQEKSLRENGRRPATSLDIDKATEYIKLRLAPYEVKIDEYENAVSVLTTNLLVRKGLIPPGWDYLINCLRCGEVPSESPSQNTVVGCPWCFSEYKDADANRTP